MRRVAVIGPNPACGDLNDERFVELLSTRLGLEAFSLRPPPGLMLAAADAPLPPLRPVPRDHPGSVVHVDADTLIWLHFSPRAYLRDWLAGWLDILLNGVHGLRRHRRRVRLIDVLRAAFVKRRNVGAEQVESLRPLVLLVELASPQQALFWLKMQEERVRETLPPRS